MTALKDGEVLARFAPAKVNLSLAVVGRRDDGYHLLDSVVAFAGIGDTLAFAPADTLSLAVDGPMARILGNQPNIIHKAAQRLAERTGIQAGAAIRLTKRLPVASGIGGGSTDAAAVIKGLCALWRISPDPALLAALALEIGADVPVCLDGHPARMTGIGEIVHPLPSLPPAWLVLVNPRTPLSTPPVFKARKGPFSANGVALGEKLSSAHDLARALARGGNDLTEAAIGLVPAIGEVIEAIGATGHCLLARMSGSGATCFGLYAGEKDARNAVRALRARNRRWWTVAAPLLAPGSF